MDTILTSYPLREWDHKAIDEQFLEIKKNQCILFICAHSYTFKTPVYCLMQDQAGTLPSVQKSTKAIPFAKVSEDAIASLAISTDT